MVFPRPFRPLAAMLVAWTWLAGPAGAAEGTGKEPPVEALHAVVGVKVTVPAEARSAATLGREREGSGVVIDSAGLIVTIGYLILEASGVEVVADGKPVPATVIGYDHTTGFGLLRATAPLGVKPMPLGASGATPERAPAIAASRGGAEAQPVVVVSKRRFAGYWEYMLDEAIFTSPPIAEFGGAALIDAGGRLIGVGSLLVGDALKEPRFPGNMFVPIDLLKPILADLLASGRSSATPHPWIGITSQEAHGRLFVAKVTPESPAEKAGLKPGDIIVAVGDQPVETLAEFYTRMWALGPAGVDVPLSVLRRAEVQRITVKSIDRLDFLKVGITY